MSAFSKGQSVRVVTGNPPPHRAGRYAMPELVGLTGRVTGRALQGMVEVTLPFPGAGKPFGFLMDPSELEPA